MTRLRSESGFTLPELLVAMALAIVVLGASVEAFTGFLGLTATAEQGANAQDAARQGIDQMTIQLRSATSSGPTGNQPIESFADYALVWLAPYAGANTTANPLGLQHIRYCLDTSDPSNEVLWLQTAPYNNNTNRNWPNTSSCPSSAWPTKTQIASNLVNALQGKPLFVTPTDSQGNATDVNVDALVDADPNKPPAATELRSSVTMRNLNHSPSASVACQGGLNGHALCDASASTDPDNQTLSFAWKMDGAALGETSYRLDQSGLASGSSHTFTVTVTDTGGLTATASQSVKMP